MPKDYKKYYLIKEEPEIVFAALTNELTMSVWTGDKVVMKPEEGTEFSLWDGSIVGKNLELKRPTKIVQEWYFEGEEQKSMVTIKLHPDKRGCSVELLHTNIPDDVYDEFAEGWDSSYFGNLMEFFAADDRK